MTFLTVTIPADASAMVRFRAAANLSTSSATAPPRPRRRRALPPRSGLPPRPEGRVDGDPAHGHERGDAQESQASQQSPTPGRHVALGRQLCLRHGQRRTNSVLLGHRDSQRRTGSSPEVPLGRLMMPRARHRPAEARVSSATTQRWTSDPGEDVGLGATIVGVQQRPAPRGQDQRAGADDVSQPRIVQGSAEPVSNSIAAGPVDEARARRRREQRPPSMQVADRRPAGPGRPRPRHGIVPATPTSGGRGGRSPGPSCGRRRARHRTTDTASTAPRGAGGSERSHFSVTRTQPTSIQQSARRARVLPATNSVEPPPMSTMRYGRRRIGARSWGAGEREPGLFLTPTAARGAIPSAAVAEAKKRRGLRRHEPRSVAVARTRSGGA